MYITIIIFSLILLFSCTNENIKKNAIFSSQDTNIYSYIYNNLDKPEVKEMLEISRENIRKLPDIIDFGIMEVTEERKYTFDNVFIEYGNFTIALSIYETLDSVSIAPCPNKTGYYSGSVYLSWKELNKNGDTLDFGKNIELKAFVVDKKNINEEENQIIEIWKDKKISKIYRN